MFRSFIMLMTGSGSYYEQYKRHKGVKPGGLQDQRLLTDRAAYISFLEVQLERVSAACLSTQGFGDRIDQIQGQLYGTEEKILNLTHLVKLSQSYYDRQYEQMGQAAAESGEQLMKLSDGVSNGDAMVREARQDVRVIAERTDDALRTHARTLEIQRLAVEDSVALLETRHATLTAKVRSGTDRTGHGGLRDGVCVCVCVCVYVRSIVRVEARYACACGVCVFAVCVNLRDVVDGVMECYSCDLASRCSALCVQPCVFSPVLRDG